jgi:hypothetical protein
MNLLRLVLPLLAAWLGLCVVLPAAAATDQELEQQFLLALKPGGTGTRQGQAGAAIRAYKAAGVLAFKPLRRDYNDYYVVTRPTGFMGHALVAVMEEYQLKYVGCCVNPGAGVYLRLNGSAQPLHAFAKANQCSVREYADRKAFLADLGFSAETGEGRFAALTCQESDEQAATAVAPAPARTAAPSPAPAAAPGAAPAPAPARNPAPASDGTVIITKGATLCADMHDMNKALAIARVNHPYAQLPDGCVLMSNPVRTRVVRESTPLPGVVVVQAGQTVAFVQRSELLYGR